MPWLQLRIDTSRQEAAAIEDAVMAAGALSVTLEDNADQPILEPALGETPLWQETRITGLFDAGIDTAAATAIIRKSLRRELPPHRWEALEDKDWEREWMNNYHPIHCGGELWICPSWLEPPQPQAVNLLLDPGLAFGTGTHPTTFLCLQWLARQQQALAGAELVDYGCGSGILGMAALLLGGRCVTGVDIDPQALLATRDNAQRNGIDAERFPVFLPGKCPPVTADIMLANILAGPLAELAPTLTAMTRPGGLLCLSGILLNQAETVMAAYRPHFVFNPVESKEEWVCLTARKVSA
jgi:ribosomal protein L11 methyltransferase